MRETEREKVSEQERERETDRHATEVKYFFIPLLLRSHIPDLMRKCNSQWKKTCDCISDKSNCCPAIEVEWRVNELRLLAFLAVVSVRLSVKRKKASLGRHYLHST